MFNTEERFRDNNCNLFVIAVCSNTQQHARISMIRAASWENQHFA